MFTYLMNTLNGNVILGDLCSSFFLFITNAFDKVSSHLYQVLFFLTIEPFNGGNIHPPAENSYNSITELK